MQNTSQKFTLICVALAFIWVNAWRPYVLNEKFYGRGDFAVFYSATQVSLLGQDPYVSKNLKPIIRKNRSSSGAFRYLYPPTALPFFLPLLMFTPKHAAYVWGILNILFVGALIWLMQSILKKRFSINEWLAIGTGLVIFGPIFTNNRLGQINIALSLLIVGTMVLAQKKKWLWSGLPLAIATMLKVFPGVVIVHYLISRQWKMVISFMLWCLAIIMTTLVLFSKQIFVFYTTSSAFGVVKNGINAKIMEIAKFDNGTLNGALHRLVMIISPEHLNELAGYISVTRLIIVAGLGVVILLINLKTKIPTIYSVSLWLAWVLFSATAIHTQYFVLLLPLLVALLIKPPEILQKKWCEVAMMISFVLISFSFLRFFPSWIKHSFLFTLPFSFIANCILLGLLLYYGYRLWQEKKQTNYVSD
ncbi:MAG: hypothetical protein A2233_01835 [Candidatus Kerfeldbacteria bacterium RIFOXYA2_FULL_38_24]|uniref:DUF2029 domain-containing protein n=1 Tax=Candidatus Kerfeldbacteria bacterium RIFOXYB2_FULL_38_14 TaxID=1798547 RepID=A0A1G2BGK4_9BACT|nr:MAG: hypothetical protein A2319_04440 [Candidatus Kerfeldbacteria bacterium RIFOXYB2_FULL_38_14]OGY87858.1 MAG: hypothetical protein A2233_01835 [Candidatus Kerfeldbacteria bacterium RIFOXYA2_FULL_38_24]OGY88503.1 MAG: hypothetical protein A2458_01910 [Candidatus Kerfeldbacteria bacterium RIFOXYC2_FULL_38_9]